CARSPHRGAMDYW
nr:immunoglobulin heavy chain junction region [Mus musculus]